MKTILLIFAVLLSAGAAFPQKEMLTKEETVNYLNKKLQEVDGRDMIRPDYTFRYSDVSFRIKGDYLELKYTETVQGRPPCYNTYVFNPGHVSGIVPIHEKTKESPVRGLRLTFPTKTARSSICPATVLSDVDKVYFPYFAALPDNRQRIEKAILHLRDLAKAEEEPFGN